MAPSTRALAILERAGVPFRVRRYDATVIRDGPSAADALGVDPRSVLKTLVVTATDAIAVGVVPVSTRLDLKAFARVVGATRVALAEAKQAERFTGYQVGAMSPIGQRHAATMVIDNSVRHLEYVFVSAGRRGFEVQISPVDLAAVAAAIFAAISSPSS